MAGTVTRKAGPLAGITYESHRQYLNALHYYRQTGVVLSPAETRTVARGQYSRYSTVQRATRRHALSRIQQRAEAEGQSVEDFLRRQRLVLANRIAATENRALRLAGTIEPLRVTFERINRPNSRFSRLWERAVREGFSRGPGDAYTELLEMARITTPRDVMIASRYMGFILASFSEWLQEQQSGEQS